MRPWESVPAAPQAGGGRAGVSGAVEHRRGGRVPWAPASSCIRAEQTFFGPDGLTDFPVTRRISRRHVPVSRGPDPTHLHRRHPRKAPADARRPDPEDGADVRADGGFGSLPPRPSAPASRDGGAAHLAPLSILPGYRNFIKRPPAVAARSGSTRLSAWPRLERSLASSPCCCIWAREDFRWPST
jgi:hypothetical protein